MSSKNQMSATPHNPDLRLSLLSVEEIDLQVARNSPTHAALQDANLPSQVTDLFDTSTTNSR